MYIKPWLMARAAYKVFSPVMSEAAEVSLIVSLAAAHSGHV
jgi:hypothetical protein